MKITFEIDTQDPDQRLELIQLQSAGKMASVLWNLEQKLRHTIKYQEDSQPECLPGLSLAQTFLIELCEEEGIKIDELSN